MTSISGISNPVSSISKSRSDQALELNGQNLLVPSGLLGELVVGQNVGALFRLAQMREPAGGHRIDTEQLGGFHAAMAGDDLLRVIDQDRIAQAELLDAACDLSDLSLRMRPGIVRVRPPCAPWRCPRPGDAPFS